MKNKETLEEVADNYSKKSSASVFQENHKRDFIEGAKWQQERSYSEEEVKQAYIDGSNNPIEEDDAYGTEFFKYMDEWFEQFKKK